MSHEGGLLLTSGALMGLTLYPSISGVSQRIFYFHVPLGWLGTLSIVVVAIASISHLITNSEKWDSPTPS